MKINREIKFRGKSVDNNEWVYGTGISKIVINTYKTNRYNIINNCDYNELDFFIETLYDTEEVIPETIGQYTGLKDKNGVEVYEGDKVMFDREWTKPTEIGIVTWNENNASFQIKGHIPSSSMKHLSRMKVIGNIYDEIKDSDD